VRRGRKRRRMRRSRKRRGGRVQIFVKDLKTLWKAEL
jgi:hypothetical protein